MLQSVDVGDRSIDAYRGAAPDRILDELREVAAGLRGARVLHVNATPYVHFTWVEAPRELDRDEVLEAFREAPRIALVRHADGVEAPNSVIEIVRDLGWPRADLWEVALWEDSLAVSGREIFLTTRCTTRPS